MIDGTDHALTDTERTIAETIVAPVLGVESLDVRHDLVELGADSKALVRILAEVEDAFGVEISPELLLDGVTVAGIAEIVDRQSSEP